MAQPVELIQLVCIRCKSPLPAGPDEAAWVCAQCGQGIRLDEDRGLVELAVNFASGIPNGARGKPFLLEVFFQLKIPVIVANFNHHLRVESNHEAGMVRQMAEDRNFLFILGEADVEAEAIENKRSIEEQARISRYTFLFHSADEVNAQAVAVAHTADDQVETVLMHFLRGSGLDGLAGMSFRSENHGWNSTKPLVRPLLETWRDEIEHYFREQGLNPIRDSSNLDSRYYRNRIRNELIPILEDFNPKLKNHIVNLSRIVQAEIEGKKNELVEVWARLLDYQDEIQLVLNLMEFQVLDLSVRRLVLRKVQEQLAPGFRNLDFDAVERIIQILGGPFSSGTQDWIAGIHVLLTKKEVIFYLGTNLPRDHELPQMIEKSVEWNPTVTFSLANGWKIKGEILANNKSFLKSAEIHDPNQAWLNAGEITFPLVIRLWKKGDRMMLFGMDGKETKLSNFWINQGIPRHARVHYPLICNKKEVMWVPGLRSSEHFRITEKTKKVLHLMLTR